MNVLSLFDGISCGQIALNRIGVSYEKYFAAEIDKYAIKVTQHNYPDTIQLGDVTTVKGENLPKIDLLIGGSPCQGFSFAGKQLNFNDPRSSLFFEFVRLLKETNPKYFLLENVKMKKEYQDVISSYLNVEPIEINSSLVSAQNRTRLYWTNIEDITKPDNKNIQLQDVLLPNSYTEFSKSHCLTSSYGGAVLWNSIQKSQRTMVWNKPIAVKKTDTATVYTIDEISVEVSQNNLKDEIQKIKHYARKLNPIECERLQTVPDNYTSVISDTQRYKCLGNGWTVDVIAHIFKNIK